MIQPGSSKCSFVGTAVKGVTRYIGIKVVNLNITI
jgi:hypothetical protein